MNRHKNIPLLMLTQVFLNTMFVIPVIVPYYRDVIGLNFHQFMVGEAVFSAVIILMEVPTGWLSDVWTRKMTMLAGILVNVFGWGVLWRAHSFGVTVFAQGTIGVSVSLLSGTNSALLYESLMERGAEGQFRRLEGLRHGIGLYAAGASALLGGYLYRWNHEAPIILTVLTSVAALVFVLLMSEPSRHREVTRKHPLADMVDTVKFALHGHADLGGIILFSAIIFVTTKMMFWAQQPYYTLLNLPLPWFGILTAAGLLGGGVGGHFGHKLDGTHDNVSVLRGCFIYVLGVCVVCGLWPNTGTVLLLLSGSVIFGLGMPKVQEALNQRAPDARRATVLSTASLMTHLFSVPMLVAVGWMTERHGVQASLLAMAVLMAAGGGGALALVRHRNIVRGLL